MAAQNAASQGSWHGTERPTLKATDPDGQAAELLRHSEAYLSRGRFAEALLAAEDALALLEKRYGREDARLAPALNAIGGVYFRQARHKDVERYYERAAAVLEKGGDPTDYAEGLANLAKLYLNSGRAKQSVPLYRRALAIYEKAFGEDLRLRTWLIIVANAESYAGDHAEAYKLLRRAGAIGSKGNPAAGAYIDGWRAEFLFRERRFEEAVTLHRAVIAVYTTHLGPQDDALAPAYAALARSLDGLGRAAEAEDARSMARSIKPRGR